MLDLICRVLCTGLSSSLCFKKVRDLDEEQG